MTATRVGFARTVPPWLWITGHGSWGAVRYGGASVPPSTPEGASAEPPESIRGTLPASPRASPASGPAFVTSAEDPESSSGNPGDPVPPHALETSAKKVHKARGGKE